MISIIVATSKNGVIGRNNEIPWHLPRDLRHFAATTKGHAVIMGRKTHESIVSRLGHPLPDRRTIVMTSQEGYEAPGTTVTRSWDEALAAAGSEDAYVCGGAEIYRLALPVADRLILTVVDAEIEGDARFDFDPSDWTLVSEEQHPADEKNEFDCAFYEYERRK